MDQVIGDTTFQPPEGKEMPETYANTTDFISSVLREMIDAEDISIDFDDLLDRLVAAGLVVWDDGWVESLGGYSGNDPSENGYVWLPGQGYRWASNEDGERVDEDGEKFWAIVEDMLNATSQRTLACRDDAATTFTVVPNRRGIIHCSDCGQDHWATIDYAAAAIRLHGPDWIDDDWEPQVYRDTLAEEGWKLVEGEPFDLRAVDKGKVHVSCARV